MATQCVWRWRIGCIILIDSDWCPGLEEISVALRAPGLLGCVLSGAGPSVLVFYLRGSEAVCGLVLDIFKRHGHASEILWTRVADCGYELAANEHEYSFVFIRVHSLADSSGRVIC